VQFKCILLNHQNIFIPSRMNNYKIKIHWTCSAMWWNLYTLYIPRPCCIFSAALQKNSSVEHAFLLQGVFLSSLGQWWRRFRVSLLRIAEVLLWLLSFRLWFFCIIYQSGCLARCVDARKMEQLFSCATFIEESFAIPGDDMHLERKNSLRTHLKQYLERWCVLAKVVRSF
jgi:hypothetical protein